MYQYLPPMLLNEFQKQQRVIASQAAQLANVVDENRQLKSELDRIKAHLGLR